MMLQRAFCMLALAGSALCLETTAPRAETVLVKAQNGETGHGWLFGVANGSAVECWIAVPEHVIRPISGTQPESFTFTDRQGKTGQSGVPMPVAAHPAALKAADGETDLAFARVEVGRPTGACRSRMGLPALSYDPVISSGPSLLVTSMLPTSYGIFPTGIVRSGLGDERAGRLILRPKEAADTERYAKGGLSGSTATVQRNGALHPFAMVLRVEGENIFTLRFDRIRAAFEEIMKGSAHPTDEAASAHYRIMDYTGTSVRPGTGPTEITTKGGCWQARAGKGEMVSVVMEIPANAPRIRGIVLDHPHGCNGQLEWISIDQRLPGASSWTLATDCRVAADTPATTCRLDLAPPRQLRLRFKSTGDAGISWLRLIQAPGAP